MSQTFYTTVGLEVHAELNTKSKMFCSCTNDPFHASRPNLYICPVCMAHPGAIPVPNIEAIKSVITVGLSIGGNIADYSEFDRKNYFYPDIPKGYQISQYKYPFVTGGVVAGVDITRIHLEEDTATSEHSSSGTLIDYNRAGVPLMELVTEPVIHTSQQAMAFGRELQLLLRTLGVSDADMEKGQMRVEVNVSISPDPDILGTKVEVKNINSFSAAGKSIDYEVARMKELWENGRQNEIVQETRGWDEASQSTKSQRSKENSADYRYFPDPDLPKIYISKLFDLNELKSVLPELPNEKRDRYIEQFGIKSDDTEFFVYNSAYARLYENTMILLGSDVARAQLCANYIISDVSGLCAELGEQTVFSRISSEHMSDLVLMISNGELGSRGAKDILRLVATTAGNVRSLATEHGLLQQNDDSALQAFVDAVLSANPDVVEQFKSGKDSVLMFLVGQVMKQSKGSANPEKVKELMLITLQK